MKAYKAFYPGLQSFNGMRFEIGKRYTTADAGIGRNGFHAALDPMFCLGFVSPERGGEYHEVDVGGIVDHGDMVGNTSYSPYSAVSGQTIRIGRKMSVTDMLHRCMIYRLSLCARECSGMGTGYCIRVVNDDRFGSCTASGELCSAIARDSDSEAFVSGSRCLAVAEGPYSSAMVEPQSQNCLAVAKGERTRIGGCQNTWLLFISGNAPKAVKVDGHTIKAGTYYTLMGDTIIKTD